MASLFDTLVKNGFMDAVHGPYKHTKTTFHNLESRFYLSMRPVACIIRIYKC